MPDPGAPGAFHFTRDARSVAALLVLAAWLCALIALWAVFQARGWIVVLLALPVLPALWELWRNPAAWLELTDDHLRWQAARSTADIALHEIDHVMLVTRWDFSIRATVHTKIGTHHRIPAEVTPKAQALEEALAKRSIVVKRQHFTVL
ncbi:hypothetical protein [Tritonibacter scottomollicae]|uniref:hypothetical protein n=1 Tax=Tritonibacter scottomollicae TaxID=483013 RepID=UPI003AA8D6EA